MTDDAKVAIPATGKLKKDLSCWEAPKPGAPRVLKRYQPQLLGRPWRAPGARTLSRWDTCRVWMSLRKASQH